MELENSSAPAGLRHRKISSPVPAPAPSPTPSPTVSPTPPICSQSTTAATAAPAPAPAARAPAAPAPAAPVPAAPPAPAAPYPGEEPEEEGWRDGWEEVYEDNEAGELVAHQSNIMEHVCKKCDKQLNNEHQFRQHMKEHMKKDNQLVNCHYCDFLANDATKYISKIGGMHSPKFKCETCGEEFYDTKTKFEHIMVVHAFNYTTQGKTSELVECFNCGEQLSSKLDLMNHKKSKHYRTKLC